MKEEKIRKFDDTQGTDRQTVQRLRPLYPLWILEGAGQYLPKGKFLDFWVPHRITKDYITAPCHFISIDIIKSKTKSGNF